MIPFPESPFLGLDPVVGGKLQTLVSRSLGSLKEHGYSVLVSDTLEDLDSFRKENAEHPDCRSPNTAFDLPYHQNETRAQGLFLVKFGRRVGTVWRRIIPLRNRRTLEPMSLKQAFKDLHVFYDDPMDAPRRETCILNSTLPAMIDRGSFCYCGFAWHDPKHRKLGLFKSISDLALVLSITSDEQWDWFVAAATEENRELAISAFPYKRYERDMTHNGQPFWLCTASYEEAVGFALKAAE